MIGKPSPKNEIHQPPAGVEFVDCFVSFTLGVGSESESSEYVGLLRLAGLAAFAIATAAGVSPSPSLLSSETLIFLATNSIKCFVTRVFERISWWDARTSFLIFSIAEDIWVSDRVCLFKKINTPIVTNSIGETRVGRLSDPLYFLSRAKVTKTRKVSCKSTRS